jgi:hypothetical protein
MNIQYAIKLIKTIKKVYFKIVAYYQTKFKLINKNKRHNFR